MNSFSRMLLKFSEAVALKFSNSIIFVNHYQMKKYPPNIQKKSVYIPNGIQEPSFPRAHDYLDKLGIKPKKYILSVGRITPEKGFDTLIKGYIRAEHGDYKLVIAGGIEFENGYRQELEKLSKEKPIIFTGYIYGDKLAQLYANAALYVLASNNEGVPLVLLEAMSYRLDVLVSNIPATHLVKLDDTDYFPKGDYEALGRKMEERLKVPKTRDYDMSGYGWGQIAEQVSSIFENVICKKVWPRKRFLYTKKALEIKG